MAGGLAQPKGYRGWMALKKTGGQTASPTVGTVYTFPVGVITPRNPNNINYMPVCNRLALPSVKVAGKKTPSVGVPAPLKASWHSAAFWNSFIGGSDSFLNAAAQYNTDEYGIGVNDGSDTRVYDGAHGVMFTLEQAAPGGVIMATLAWLARYGDSEAPTPTTFATAAPDTGALLDVTNVSFATATDVHSWRLTVMRPQGYQMTADGTLYAATVEAGMLGGTLRLVQNKKGTAPTTTETITIGGVAFALALSADEMASDIPPSLVTMTNDYTFFGASAIAIS